MIAIVLKSASAQFAVTNPDMEESLESNGLILVNHVWLPFANLMVQSLNLR